MAVLSDNDMIMHRDVECFGSVDELLGHIDVGARWCGITGRMVVDQNNGGGGEFQSPFDHFARIDRRVVHRARLLDFIGNQFVLLVEKQDAELLAGLVSHGRGAIFDHLIPRAKYFALHDGAARTSLGDSLYKLEFMRHSRTGAGNFGN